MFPDQVLDHLFFILMLILYINGIFSTVLCVRVVSMKNDNESQPMHFVSFFCPYLKNYWPFVFGGLGRECTCLKVTQLYDFHGNKPFSDPKIDSFILVTKID